MMTLLKKVKLCGKLDPCWDEIPEHFRQAFLDCVHLPSMEDVSILQVSNFPLSALNNVKRLALEWEDESLLDTITLDDSGAHELQLESLSLIKFGCVSLQRVIAWIPPCTLRSLAILDCDALECLAPLFDKCSNSLTDLQLDLGPQFRSCTTFMLGDASVDDSPLENFPFTLSTLLHLEELTFHAEVEFSTLLGSFGLWDGLPKNCHPIPPIKHAVKTISFQTLKLLELDFKFTINTYALPPGEAIWSSLVHLVAESHFCIKLYVGVTFYDGRVYRDIAPDIILNSLAESAELMKYVNRGVLVIIPELPN